MTLLTVSFALLAGLVLTRVFKPFKLPAVTAYLIAGVLIGPYCLGSLNIEGIGFTSMEEQGMYESMLGFTDQELYSMIECLGEPASLIISLHYGYEETYEEIALLLGMNVNTVRTISMRSRKKLKGMIEEANTCGTRNRL